MVDINWLVKLGNVKKPLHVVINEINCCPTTTTTTTTPTTTTTTTIATAANNNNSNRQAKIC